MAGKEVKILIGWENNIEFKVTEEDEFGHETVLILVEENGCIDSVWGTIQNLFIQYMNQLAARIGVEMKEP